MINRLELNKKPVYVLPDNVLVGIYMNKYKEVEFSPDLCICVWGAAVGKICEYRETAKQICVKSDDKNLIDFIKNYNWSDEAHKMATPNLNMWKFKKVLLEKFYNANK